MRTPPHQQLERMRRVDLEMQWGGCSCAGTMEGIFEVRLSVALRMISSTSHDWEHVSVSTPRLVPTWEDMCWVKGLFWDPEEAVMQLHPPESTWVNNNPHTLHLWRPLSAAIPLPPPILVGIKDLGVIDAKRAKDLRVKLWNSTE